MIKEEGIIEGETAENITVFGPFDSQEAALKWIEKAPKEWGTDYYVELVYAP